MLESILQSNSVLNTLCYIPLIMSILLCLTEDGIDTLPKTQTKLFEKFIIMTIVHFLRKGNKVSNATIASFKDIPHPYDQVVKELSQFAFLALQRNELVFTLAEIITTYPNLTPTNWFEVGLLNPARYFKSQDGCDYESFHFLHFAIQEYMAAYHIASLPDETQLRLLNDTFWDVQYHNTWVMYVGITGGNNFIFKHFLTGNPFQMLSQLFGTSSISNTILSDRIKCLHLLPCLAEADHEMLPSVENIFQGGIIDLSYQFLSSKDIHTLAVLLLRSPNKYWEMINLSHCYIDDETCNVFCQLFRMIELKVKSVDVSFNSFTLESLNKLCILFRLWNTEELIISVDALYTIEETEVTNTFSQILERQIGTSLVFGTLADGVILVTYMAELNRVIVIFSNRYGSFECTQFNGFNFYDCSILIEHINHMGKSRQDFNTIGHVAFSYAFTDFTKKPLSFFSKFQLVRVCGSYMHSKGVYLLNIPSKVEYDHNFNKMHHYGADYLAAVMCNAYRSNASYLTILHPDQVKVIKSVDYQRLYISNSNIGSGAADDIATVISCSNTKLLKLSLHDDNLEAHGALNIARGLQNTSSLTEFYISNNNIGSEAADYIAAVLSQNTGLLKFYIHDNNLGTTGAIKIARGLQSTSSLTEFTISNNNIGSEAANDIAAVLSQNTGLLKFYIHDNNLGTTGTIKIARGLQSTSSLTEFTISSNNIGSEAAYDIAVVLSQNTKLLKLYLGNNNLEMSGAIMIAAGLQYTSSLTEFSISSNNIGSEAADDIAAVLSRNTKLLKLYIRDNNLETSGTLKITKGFQKISSLTEFAISSNNIGSEAADGIASILYQNTKLLKLYLNNNNLEMSGAIMIAAGLQYTSSLTEFNISSNNIGSEAADDIATVLSLNTNLQILYIKENNLGNEGAIKIVEGLQNASSLKELDISSNSIGGEAADDIAAVLHHKSKLQKLYINQNNLESLGAVKIAKALQDVSTLTEFNISNNNIGSEAAINITTILHHNTNYKLQILL